MAFKIQEFATRRGLAEQLADDVVANLVGDMPSLFLSGGSTPKLFLETLATKKGPWSKTLVSLVDERWVPSDHEDSNAALVKELFLAKRPVGRFMPLYTGDENPVAGVKTLSPAFDAMGIFSVAVLGMGLDAHTASLFPGRKETEDAFASKKFVAATKAKDAPHPRLSITPRFLENCGKVALHIEGPDKRRVFDVAAKENTPIGRVVQNPKLNVQVYWTEQV